MQSKYVKFFISLVIAACLTFGSVARGQTYYVQPGDSLASIAARYGTTTSAIRQANGLTTTMIQPGQALRVSRPNNVRTDNSTYTVCAGDSLAMIAERYQTTITALKEANNLSANYVTPGRRLIIPSAYRTHQVQAGESLFLIAQKYGVSVATLQQTNALSGDSIQQGQNLKIPVSRGEPVNTGYKIYITRNGDSLYLIAKRYGLTLDALLAANHLKNYSFLYTGQRLYIPQTSSGSGSSGNNYNLSQSDLDLLARLVSAESDGEPFAGQVAVAATILNRLEDPRYPKTIPGIIYQVDNGSYQYSPVLDGRINLPASSSAYQAVQQALSGSDPSNGANGFYNPAKTTNQWVRSQPVTATIGNHVFFSS